MSASQVISCSGRHVAKSCILYDAKHTHTRTHTHAIQCDPFFVPMVHTKGDQSWVFTGRTDVEAETPILWPPHAELTHWKRPWCWERLKAGGEGDDRGWDGWMASPTRWTGVWVDSGSWWWTGRPGVLWFAESQRVRHDWATELNWKFHCSTPQRPLLSFNCFPLVFTSILLKLTMLLLDFLVFNINYWFLCCGKWEFNPFLPPSFTHMPDTQTHTHTQSLAPSSG